MEIIEIMARYNPDIHHRCSIRLREYDYSQSGAYFVTICTQHKECLFGEVIADVMNLNAAGEMIKEWYLKLEQKFTTIKCGSFICMPNHVHFVVFNSSPKGTNKLPSLSSVVQWFKTMTTNSYIKGVQQYEWKSFNRKLWQRNYYEHIIRNENDLNNVFNYIEENPAR